MDNIELLAPAGNLEKLKTALYFGADAVYCGGKQFSLRANSDNFDENGLKQAIELTHSMGKKLYVTANIMAFDGDFNGLGDYFLFLQQAGADAVIVSDLGVMECCKRVAPKLDIHISTQASITNKHAAKIYAELGAKRIILARELSLDKIKRIRDYLPNEVEIETFVHGAMCVSYSGRCLISNLLSKRAANRGECVQACRWKFGLSPYKNETDSSTSLLDIEEDERGTYILNSKDLNMLAHIAELRAAGVVSFKIEGRMKTAYYVATVVNAYRRALDCNDYPSADILAEPFKAGHREFTTGFYFGEEDTVNQSTSGTTQEYDFIAIVTGYDEQRRAIIVEQRNRFTESDQLEILSPKEHFNKTIVPREMFKSDGERVAVADKVQEILYIPSEIRLRKGDILRRKR